MKRRTDKSDLKADKGKEKVGYVDPRHIIEHESKVLLMPKFQRLRLRLAQERAGLIKWLVRYQVAGLCALRQAMLDHTAAKLGMNVGGRALKFITNNGLQRLEAKRRAQFPATEASTIEYLTGIQTTVSVPTEATLSVTNKILFNSS